jgi:hypothetical protein
VPRSYLDRWAESGRVHVRRRDGKTFDTDPTNVAVEAGFYDMPDGAGGVSKWIEAGLAEIDDNAVEVLRSIVRTAICLGLATQIAPSWRSL